ncbi:hypothetical protein AS96_14165 [Microbacterium sp. MRS-1]|nr:hypothetical protein AS96_14165 [Microbacterium sp. MRS-1]
MNSYEFGNYSLDSREQVVKELRGFGFMDEVIQTHLDIVDADIRRIGLGGCVLLNLCVTPPVMVTVRGGKLARR